MSRLRSKNKAGDALHSNKAGKAPQRLRDRHPLTQLASSINPQYTARSQALLWEVFRIYECRQSVHTDLSAPNVARLLRAVNKYGLAGPQERAMYLNPMRDLFTDNELSKLQSKLAQMEDHRIVIWGPDLTDFLRRVQNANTAPTGKVLDLWIIEVSTKSAEQLEQEGFKGERMQYHWGCHESL